ISPFLGCSPSCCFSVYSTVLDSQRTFQRPFVEHIQLAIVSNGCFRMGSNSSQKMSCRCFGVVRHRVFEIPSLRLRMTSHDHCGRGRPRSPGLAGKTQKGCGWGITLLMVIVASRWWVDLLSTST
ncbi:unnamed protein product, partial [Musa banksii]